VRRGAKSLVCYNTQMNKKNRRDHIPRCECGKAVYFGNKCYDHQPKHKRTKSAVPGFFVRLS
jgi:hypothetical protein